MRSNLRWGAFQMFLAGYWLARIIDGITWWRVIGFGLSMWLAIDYLGRVKTYV